MLQVRATALSSYVQVARAVGLDPYELLNQAGIRPSSLDDLDNRIPAAAAVGLVELSAARSGCPAFGLLMAEARSVENIGALMLLLKHLRSARDLIQSMVRYQSLLTKALMISLHDEDGVSSFHMDLVGQLAQPQALDFAIASTHRVFSSILGAGWAPDAVHFVHGAPDDLTVYRRVFNCPVAFDSSFNGFSARSSALDARSLSDESTLAPYATSYLDSLVATAGDDSLAEQVRRSLYVQLPCGRASLAAVAADLALSPRSLQRQIADNGQSFGALLNEVRKELATRCLRDPARDVTAAALMSGYSTSSSFNRWFMQEFGETPTAWRSRLRSP